MSQNDKLLIAQGLPALTHEERVEKRREWQSVTWEDMKKSFSMFNKYIMLRPTGFGKTYTCAQATNLDSVRYKRVIFVYTSDILRDVFEQYGRGKHPIIKSANKRDGNSVQKK
jgi:hypothetical protein